MESVVRAVPGVVFLRSDPNPDQNRTVFTFAGPGRSVLRAAFNLIRKAVEKVDLTRHLGTHPRMGAMDVVPLVPLGTTTMETASELARRLGEDVGTKLQLPVFLYEESATRAERRSLSDLRRGGFEGHLAHGFPVGPPDFGPARPHPTAGSVAIGARFFIIALHVILDTNDLEIAKTVASEIRESARGLAAVRALGLPLASQGLVQIAINILDYRLTSITKVMDRVREEARRLGTTVLESELIGVVPREALAGAVWDLLRLPPQRRERVVEDAVEKSGAFSFAERLAAATPTPGGGAAAARTGLHATSLLRMVTGLTLHRLKGASQAGAGETLSAIHEEAMGLSKKLRDLEIADVEAFESLLEANRNVRGFKEPAAGLARSEGPVATAARAATEVPIRMLQAYEQVLQLIGKLLDTARQHTLSLRAGGDLGGAIELIRAASRTACLNIQINLPQLSIAIAGELRQAQEQLEAEIEKRCDRLRAEVVRQYAPS